MCVLPVMGSDPSPWLLIGMIALVLGALLLVRTRRGRVGLIATAALFSALLVSAPQPASAADCSPVAPPVTSTLLAVSPGSWIAGSAAGSQDFAVTNAGTVLTAVNVSTALAGSTAFSVTASTCAAALAPGASCIVSIAFAPPGTTLATLSATLAVAADNAAAVSVALEGTDGAVALLAMNHAVMTVNLGDTQFVTVTNTSLTTAFNLTVSELSGLVTLSTNCGAALAPGSSCEFGVYAPFTSSPGATQVQIAGDNTNVLLLPVTVA